MKQELNIAAILKDKLGLKLWSPAYGDVYLYSTNEEPPYPIGVAYNNNEEYDHLTERGKLSKAGEPMLFPSKEMQDWEKFAWKKGDVLCCGIDNLCVFDKWISLDYTEFYAEFVTPNYSGAILNTKDWVKVTNEDTIKQHISKIEEIKGGKLNLETLEIEHPKQEKKHGSESEYIQVSEYAKQPKFQPFDKVLVRNAKDEIWFPRLFAYEGDTYIICIDGDDYQFCIPYNDFTKHLLGTTKDWEGGDV